MASDFGLRELFEQVSTVLPTKGVTCEHLFGAQGLTKHRATNTYVWVPRETRRDDTEATRGIDKHRVNHGARHFVEIHCWGETHEVAFLMAESLLFAIREETKADVRFERADWLDFEERGDSELGEPYVVQLSMGQAFVRRYTPIAAYSGASQTVVTPTVPTTDPTTVTIEVHATEDVNQDGTVMGSDTITG